MMKIRKIRDPDGAWRIAIDADFDVSWLVVVAVILLMCLVFKLVRG